MTLGEPPINNAWKSVSGKSNEDMIQNNRIIYKRVTILLTMNDKKTCSLSYFHLKVN